MTTQILSLPLVKFTAEVATNGDWIDAIQFRSLAAQVLVQATIRDGGTGYADGIQTLTVIGGAGTAAAQVTVLVSNGVVAAVTGIAAPGSYSMLPVLEGCPVSGGGGSGCTLDLIFKGSPIDISGIAFEMMVRTTADDDTVWLDLSTDGGTLVNGGATGILTILGPYTKLREWTEGDYVADIRASADNRKIVVAQGTITATPGVTRP